MFAQLWQVQQISDEAGSLSVNCSGCLHQRVWVITLTCFLFKISLYDHLADVPPPPLSPQTLFCQCSCVRSPVRLINKV